MGLGQNLMMRCLNALARQGVPKCNIFLFDSNDSGRAFWEHNGWKQRPDLRLLQKMTRET